MIELISYDNCNPKNINIYTGDCLIKAIMIALDRTKPADWYNIYDDLYRLGLEKCRVFNDPIIIEKYMKQFGFKFRKYNDYKPNLEEFINRHCKNKNNICLIGVPHHIMTYKDNKLYDDSITVRDYNYLNKLPNDTVYYYLKKKIN